MLPYGTRIRMLQGPTAFLFGRVTSGDVEGMGAVIKPTILLNWL
jgi:hypothetical protein